MSNSVLICFLQQSQCGPSLLPLLRSLFTSLLFLTRNIKTNKKRSHMPLDLRSTVFFHSFFCGVWRSAARDPCSIQTEQCLPRGPECFSCVLSLIQTGQVSQGECSLTYPQPRPHKHTHTHHLLYPSFFAISIIQHPMSLTTSIPEHNTKENHHHPSWALRHSPKEMRERKKKKVVISNSCWGKWSLSFPCAAGGHFLLNVEWCFATSSPHREDKSFSQFHSTPSLHPWTKVSLFVLRRRGWCTLWISPPCLILGRKRRTPWQFFTKTWQVESSQKTPFRVSDNSVLWWLIVWHISN